MSHFRDRVILEPGNIPQLLSGKVRYSIGAYRIGLALRALDSIVPTQTVGTALGAVNIYTANPPTTDLGTLIPTQTISAHSP